MKITCPIHECARSFPETLALLDGRNALTFSQLDLAIDCMVSFLAERNFRKGDVIAVLGPNSLQQALLFFASLRLGSIFLPLNHRLTETDWKSQLKQAGAKLLICDARYHPEYVGCQTLLSGDVRLQNSSSRSNRNDLDLDRECLIIFSSGSTASPQGVVLTVNNIYHSAQGTNQALELHKGDCWLAALPFFHVGGLSILFRSALAGSSVFILEKFDLTQVLSLIQTGQVNILSLVPTMMKELLEIDEGNILQGLKTIILGGAPVSKELTAKINERCLPICTTYGLTETASMVTLSSLGNITKHPLCSGRVLSFRQLRIADADGNSLPGDELGRIMVKGEVLFSHYLDRRSHHERNADGWFDTGDIGYLDKADNLVVTGRADRMIISGGEKINLDQIEEVIRAIEGVRSAAVLSRTDARWGQRPVAFVVREDRSLTESRCRVALSRALPKLMVPDIIEIIDEMPLTGSGKVDQASLIRMFPTLFAGNQSAAR